MLENPVIDVSAIEMLQQYGPNDFVVKILEVWLETLPASLEKIGNGVQAKDCSAVAFAAHSLKSSSGNIGLRQLQSLASNMEASGRQEDFESLLQLYASFGPAVEEAKSAVFQMIRELED